ncbi:hypothetical protein N0V88_004361 [Collariella sp. IMI 366227]|nr:hypothetical protein N0V88_004361 [Collariella sp. IMI 366227]
MCETVTTRYTCGHEKLGEIRPCKKHERTKPSFCQRFFGGKPKHCGKLHHTYWAPSSVCSVSCSTRMRDNRRNDERALAQREKELKQRADAGRREYEKNKKQEEEALRRQREERERQRGKNASRAKQYPYQRAPAVPPKDDRPPVQPKDNRWKPDHPSAAVAPLNVRKTDEKYSGKSHHHSNRTNPRDSGVAIPWYKPNPMFANKQQGQKTGEVCSKNAAGRNASAWTSATAPREDKKSWLDKLRYSPANASAESLEWVSADARKVETMPSVGRKQQQQRRR